MKEKSKKYIPEGCNYIDSYSHIWCDEFIYLCETLLESPDKKYFIHCEYMRSPYYYQDDLEKGIYTNEDMEPKEELYPISFDKAVKWLKNYGCENTAEFFQSIG